MRVPVPLIILESLDISRDQFAAGTGWDIKPEGACKADVCVPLDQSGGFDVAATAERLRMALVHDEGQGCGRSGRSRAWDRAARDAPQWPPVAFRSA